GKSFHKISSPVFKTDRASEDTDCAWFDADGDGDKDLYVASGGSEFPASSSALGDRLYINNGASFTNHSSRLPSSRYQETSVVAAADFDGDGDIDLFIGSHFKPFAYGIPADGCLLLNDGTGNFEDVTQKLSPDLLDLGMITDAKWADIDGDGDLDLVIVGEWMPVTVFQNQLQQTGKATFKNVTQSEGLANTSGWWHSVQVADLDGDGYRDIIAGNEGLNNRFQRFIGDSLQLWVNDFDQNGSIEQILTYKKGDRHVPLILKSDMEDQLPMLKSRIKSFKWYADHSMEDLFKKNELKGSLKLKVSTLDNSVFWNNGGKIFTGTPLPFKTQLAPLYGISKSYSSDGNTEILMGGNLSGVKPQAGDYMSSYGDMLTFSSSRNIHRLEDQQSGFFIKGEVRAILPVEMVDGSYILVARNNDTPLWFKRNR
ncbi:MAG TPA: VCBS repeat-containing protein, partial [Balneolaceae bacterium]|nr:VCBS repeat-containing protein [Balneolaceae bacterium]